MQFHIHNLPLIILMAPTTPFVPELAFVFSYCKKKERSPIFDISFFLYQAHSKNHMKVVGFRPNSSGIYVSPEAATLNIILSQGTCLLLPCIVSPNMSLFLSTSTFPSCFLFLTLYIASFSSVFPTFSSFRLFLLLT